MTPARSSRVRSTAASTGMTAVCTLLVWSAAGPAHAHLHLTQPRSRYGGDVLKTSPCGKGDGERTTDNITTYAPGETIEVVWDEYIDHPSHYRIAFDDIGADGFADPACVDNCSSSDMVIEEYTNDTVLLDGIEDPAGSDHAVEVTLPDIECDECTLQVIQVMYDKPPYEKGGNDIYYQCADLVLEARPSDGGVPDASLTPDASVSAPGGGADAAASPADPVDSDDVGPGGGPTNASAPSGADAGTAASARPPGVEGSCSAGSRRTPSAWTWPLLVIAAGHAARRRKRRPR